MPTSRNDVRVKCPFYQYDEKLEDCWRIVCEGVGAADTMQHRFRSGLVFQTFIDTRCCRSYERCPAYRRIAEKYREE